MYKKIRDYMIISMVRNHEISFTDEDFKEIDKATESESVRKLMACFQIKGKAEGILTMAGLISVALVSKMIFSKR